MIAGAFSSTSGKADITLTTNGDVLYYNSGRQRLAIGSEGKVLTVSDADLPAWETASGLTSPLTANLVINDNINLLFGTGSDASIDYNGTNMIIDPRVSGSGSLLLNAGSFYLAQAEAITISSGAISPTRNIIHLDTEGSGATDDLNTVNAPVAIQGHIIIMNSTTGSRDPTIKDGGGNLLTAGDFTMTSNQDEIILINSQGGSGEDYFELSRSDNA